MKEEFLTGFARNCQPCLNRNQVLCDPKRTRTTKLGVRYMLTTNVATKSSSPCIKYPLILASLTIPKILSGTLCEGLEYSMMTELESCQLYTTTTTTTDRNQRHTSGTVISVKINFLALFIMLICIKILQHMSS